MADAGARRETCDVHERLPRVDEERWRALCPLRCLERHVLRGVHNPGGCRMCVLLRSIWADRQARSNHHPDCSQTGLLFPLALCFALTASAIARDAVPPDRTNGGD